MFDHHAASAEPLRCSFCGKAQAEVNKIIAGPTVFICDECVDVCIEIMADDQRRTYPEVPKGSAESEGWRARAAALPGHSAACSLCRTSASVKEMLAVENRGMLCGECANAVEDALAQGKPIS
jgi:hypothetical protein